MLLPLILFILLLPVFLLFWFFQILTLGFEKLGIPSEITLFILFLMLIGSFINIPLTKKKFFYIEQPYFFGLFKKTKVSIQGVFINLGGAIIPAFLSLYFLTKVPLGSVLIATGLMIAISNFYARLIPGKGIAIPVFVPHLFATFFAFVFNPGFTAPTAFISGVLGTLIGADILNLRKVQKSSFGFISIGGAGVFDGIFLVGIISALLAGFLKN